MEVLQVRTRSTPRGISPSAVNRPHYWKSSKQFDECWNFLLPEAGTYQSWTFITAETIGSTASYICLLSVNVNNLRTTWALCCHLPATFFMLCFLCFFKKCFCFQDFQTFILKILLAHQMILFISCCFFNLLIFIWYLLKYLLTSLTGCFMYVSLFIYLSRTELRSDSW